MRVMVIIKANKESEAGIMPSEKLLTDMGKFNEELVNAGIMLDGEGLHPSSKAKRVKFSGGKRLVTDGPFAEIIDEQKWGTRDANVFECADNCAVKSGTIVVFDRQGIVCPK